MSDQFDPYYEWLGIPPRDQPANHYRLLGIEVFEENLNVIEKAADRQMGHLRTFQNGQRSAESQRLLNELSAAKVTLLQSDKKSEYDEVLRAQIQAEIAPASAPDLPIPIAQPVAPTVWATPQPSATTVVSRPKESAAVLVLSTQRKRTGRRRNQSARIIAFVGTGVGVVAVGLIAAVFSGVLSSPEPVKPSPPRPQRQVSSAKQATGKTTAATVVAESDGTPDEKTPAKTKDGVSQAASTLTKIDESQQTIKDLDFAEFASALSSTTPSELSESIDNGGGIVADRLLLCQSVAYDEFVKLLRPLAKYGWRPLRIRPYIDNGIQVAAVWTRDGRPWRFVAGVTESEFLPASQRLQDAGFEPLDVAGFGDAELRFAGVWVKPAGKPPESEVWLAQTPAEFKAGVNSRRGSPLVTHTRHVFVFQNSYRYSVVWKPSPSEATLADRFGGTRSFFESRLRPNDHLLDIVVAKSNVAGHVIEAALVRGLPATTQLYSLTPEEHLRRSRELAEQGLVPTSISVAMQRSGQAVAASVWESSPDATGMTSRPVAKNQSTQTAATRYALHFYGRSSVVLSNTRGLFDLDKQFTAEVWFRVTKQPASNLIACFGTGAGKALHPDVTGPPMAGWLMAAGRISKTKPGDSVAIRWSDATPKVVGISNTVPALNKDWHHLAVCNEPQPNGGWLSQTFLDGVSRMTVRRSAGEIHPSPSDFFLGVSEFVSAQTSFHGDIRACRLSSGIRYRNQFTPDETFVADESTLVLLKFDGGDPRVIHDVSGGNRHGQIHGATWIAMTTQPTPKPRPNPKPLLAEATPQQRLAVPSSDERRTASERVKDIYRADFAEAKDATAMVSLANDLIQQASKTEEAAAKFGLLFEARLLAIRAVNPRLALHMTKQLTDTFEVASWTLKADTMAKLTDAAKSPEERRVLAGLVLEMSEEALLAREFEAADKQIELMARLNRPRDRELGKASLELKTRITDGQKVWQQAEQAKQKLTDSPDDPEAHLTIGRYLSFVTEDWENGLPHLARGSNATLQELASKDLQDPSEGQEQLGVADAWYAWGEKVSGSDRNGAWLRAQYWYKAALPALADLDRTKADRRLAAISDKVTSNARQSSTFAWLDAPVGEVKTLTGHTSEVTSLALLRGGSQLISGSRDQSIRVWDLAQGKQIGIVQSTIGSVRALGVTGDEKFLVVSGDQANVEVWNLSTSKLAHRVKAKSAPNNMELVRDANVIVVSRGSSASGNIGIFALHGAASGQLNCPSSPRCLAVSDSGKLVAAGAADDKVYVWSLRPAKMADPFTGLGNDPVAIDISPDEKLVAACSYEQAMVWRLDSGEMVSRMQITNRADGLVTNRADGLAFSIDGRRLLTTSYNGVTVWNVEDGSRVDTLTPSRSTDSMLGQRRPIVCLPDPRGAVSTGTGGIIRVWRLPD